MGVVTAVDTAKPGANLALQKLVGLGIDAADLELLSKAGILGAEATVRLREQLDELAKASELTTAALAEFGIVLDGLEWDE